ncbi:hypothetical protein M404DRAFT_157473 [Pisolithus tinctorius Marx 270]|uniref:Uncharacterized protein n=1 Tax=Pisolithus tinctorius Marx 270 TaxID=870435 RepID=A0A0C3NSY4_PISTI|nr:hypothetical protein M404DRAFT_157473 [Pisolithus tinctorius Marx 270]
MIPSVSSIIHPGVISSVPSLPPALIAYATIPLPMSPLFLEAAESADALDESDLLKWEREPPYTYAKPDPTPEEQRFTRNLVDVMLGRHARLLGEADTHRAKHLENGDHQQVFTELMGNIAEKLVRWSAIYDTIGGPGMSDNRNIRMAACWLQWQAQDIYHITQEALELENGRDRHAGSS